MAEMKTVTVLVDEPLSLVREFHTAFNCYTAPEPAIPPLSPVARRKMEQLANLLKQGAMLAHVFAENHRGEEGGVLFTRIQLIIEEVQELVAKGLLEGNIVEALDALGDIDYVVSGAYLTLGLGDLRIDAIREIHRSNMTKLGPDGKPIINAAGRVVKGPAYEPPNLEQFFHQTKD